MASYCKQCSETMFGKDFRDFAGIAVDGIHMVMCEGCGYTQVDHEGRCVRKGCVDFQGNREHRDDRTVWSKGVRLQHSGAALFWRKAKSGVWAKDGVKQDGFYWDTRGEEKGFVIGWVHGENWWALVVMWGLNAPGQKDKANSPYA